MKNLVLMIILMSFLTLNIYPCTTAIVSGKYTKDGRPLIFKHRDTGWLQNKVVFIKGERYDFLAVVNSNDQAGDTIWMGTNSAGFSIMNSASYNLNIGDTVSTKDLEGVLMRRALAVCRTLKDFETFLDTLSKPMGVATNLGVIDSYGGAAYYETGNWGYVKFDVNDSKVAPFGYIIRTNYSFTGLRDAGHGYIRYLTTTELFYEAEAMDKISDKFILTEVSRCLKNSLTGTDYGEYFPEESSRAVFVPGIDLTMRNSSAATFLCKGVRKGEDPALNTMWVILGYQLCAPAIPLWVGSGNSIPDILKGNEKGTAPLCDAALKLKEQIYPVERGHGKDYMNLTRIVNGEGSGIYQAIRGMENQIFTTADKLQADLYKEGFNREKTYNFYRWAENFLKKEYIKNFNLNL